MSPLLALSALPVLIAAAIIVIVVMRRRRGPLDIGPVTAFVAGAYALVVSLLLVATIGQFDAGRYSVVDEASFSTNLFENASFFPTADRIAVQHGVVCLVRSTIAEDWLTAAEGDERGNPHTLQRQWQLARALTAAGASVEKSGSTLTAYDHALTNLDARNDARSKRLYQSRAVTAPAQWVVLLVGAFVVIVLVGLELKTTDRVSQIIVLGMLIATIVILLTAIALIDKPYSGIWHIEPTSLESALNTMQGMPGSADAFRPCEPLPPLGS